ncbi:MAG: hypothetical protein COA42_00960 [Alteromonadaceae bacterium]|nr:MAG: hypothetical protein COA42_00960 [Alteromonadaceae bacterium]
MTLRPSLPALSLALMVAIFSQLPQAAIAKALSIPVGQQGKPNTQNHAPTGGMSMQQVESVFGTPTTEIGPIGQPAIYYWEYANFTVYFEGDVVLHSVLER